MINYVIIGLATCLLGFLPGNHKSMQADWKVLSITRGCSENGKQCVDKLTIDRNLVVKFSRCGQPMKSAKLDNSLLQKITALNKAKVKEWDIEHYIDSVCGYLIELDNSKSYTLFFDADPKYYDSADVKSYLQTLNQAFDQLK